MRISKPLKLDGTYNTRELGGYKAADGRITKEHSLLRSDALHDLTEADIEFLYSYGVRAVIDMRSDWEVGQAPCSIKTHKNIEYIRVPLLDHIHSEKFDIGFPNSLEDMYIGLYKNSQSSISEVLRAILKHSDDCVIYNCTAGKDRTGIISVLMLLLSGVDVNTAISDYSATRDYTVDLIKKRKMILKESDIKIPDYLFDSPAMEMENTLKWFFSYYKNVDEYIKTIGLSQEEVNSLKNKLF